MLCEEEEARYGYLAAVNSTTLDDGAVLDLGGGSLQLVRVKHREARDLRSWPLGAVRMTERFLDHDGPGRQEAPQGAAQARRRARSPTRRGSRKADRLVGIGGTVRNLAVAAQHAADLPTFGVQGFTITREALDDLVEQLADLPPSERAKVPGHQVRARRRHPRRRRGDPGRARGRRVRRASRSPRRACARACSSSCTTRRAGCSTTCAARACSTSTTSTTTRPSPTSSTSRASCSSMFDDLADAGLHDGDAAERELLWAAAMLHDIGVSVDYDDHHKHSRYLILNAGLPGWSQREIALIAQMARYHRKGSPGLDDLAALGRKGDRELVQRCSALLRVAEQLERSRDQLVREAHVEVENGSVRLRLVGGERRRLARPLGRRSARPSLFERTFSKPLEVVGD